MKALKIIKMKYISIVEHRNVPIIWSIMETFKIPTSNDYPRLLMKSVLLLFSIPYTYI